MTPEFNARHGGWQVGIIQLLLFLVWFAENSFVMPVFKELLNGMGLDAPDGTATILRMTGWFRLSEFAVVATAIAIAGMEATLFSALYRRFGQWAAWTPSFLVTLVIAGALFANAYAMAAVSVAVVFTLKQ